MNTEGLFIELIDEERHIRRRITIEELQDLISQVKGRRKDGKEAGRKTEGRKTEG